MDSLCVFLIQEPWSPLKIVVSEPVPKRSPKTSFAYCSLTTSRAHRWDAARRQLCKCLAANLWQGRRDFWEAQHSVFLAPDVSPGGVWGGDHSALGLPPQWSVPSQGGEKTFLQCCPFSCQCLTCMLDVFSSLGDRCSGPILPISPVG